MEKEMSQRKVYPSVVEAMMLPKIVRLSKNLSGAAFVLMKLLPARFMLDRAQENGLLELDTVVIETSSGTFGLALSILCNLRGLDLILVSDPAIDTALQRRLRDLSTRLEIVQEPAPSGGFQRARLDRLEECRSECPRHFWPSQYDNPHNPGAYSKVAELLVETLGRIDCLVGPVGSGGSMCGTTSYLRLLFPDLYAIAVDTHGSVLFGQPDQKRTLRGLGNSLMPENLDHSVFDEVHWVSGAEGFTSTRLLHRRHSLYMGPTSGASYMVARWWAEKNPDATVVVLLPDEGYRYSETVYNDKWMQKEHLFLASMPDAPCIVDDPAAAASDWTCMNWNRRTYAQVVGRPFEAKKINHESLVSVY